MSFVKKLAESYRGIAKFPLDIRVSEIHEESLNRHISKYKIRAYHATRLLSHEIEGIRLQGLIRLSPKLVKKRIQAAVNHGALSIESAEEVLSGSALSAASLSNRKGKVCLFLSDYNLRKDIGSVRNLLRYWGGEATYQKAGAKIKNELSLMGTPTIVSVNLVISGGQSKHRFLPSLGQVFVGAALGMKDRTADVEIWADVPPEAVVDISCLGSNFYGRFPHLPQI